MTLQLAVTEPAIPALVPFGLSCLILLCGDKVVRPMTARGGTRLPFVWVLMGCLGGFEVLGVSGLVIGPVLLTLARDLWEQRIREIALEKSSPVVPAVEGSARAWVGQAK